MEFAQTLQTTDRVGTFQRQTTNWQIGRALISLASAALLMRVGGMLNQVVVSANFGAGASMDAYVVASAFPLLLVQLLSSAIEAAVIPVYSRLRMRASCEEISRLFSTLVNALFLGALLLGLLLFLARQPLVHLSAPGLDSARQNQALVLTPLLYLVMPLSLLLGLLEAILNAEGQFGWPAYAGILVPLTTVLFTRVEGRTYGVFVLCLGALCGTFLQLVVVLVRVRQARLRYRCVLDWHSVHARTIVRRIWPVLLGALISQGSPLVDQAFASTLPPGNVSALTYALKLVSLFSGVIFVSLGRALLPHLAREAALGDPHYRVFKKTLRLYLWSLILCTLLLSIGTFLIAGRLVKLLFQHGAFSPGAAEMVSDALRGFLVGLVPMAVSFLLVRAFNALGETRTPMRLALLSVSVNALLDVISARLWQIQGIALATSGVYLINSILLVFLLYRRIGNLQLWRLPDEFLLLGTCFRCEGRKGRLRLVLTGETWPRYMLGMLAAMGLLVLGAVASAYAALLTLRIVLGILMVICLLRYPGVLLLALASVNVGIGSSLALWNGNNLDLVLVLPLLLWFGVVLRRGAIWRTPGLIWQLLFLAWILPGISFSPLAPKDFLTLWLIMLAYPSVYVLATVFLITRQRLLILVDALLLTGLLTALYGLYGFFTHQHGETDSLTHVFRITSLFTQATTFALYLSLLVPLALYRCCFSRGATRVWHIGILLSLNVSLLFTFTRAAYLSLFIGVVILALCTTRHRVRIVVIAGLIGLCVLIFLLGGSGQLPFLARFFNGDLATLNGRVYLWQALLSRFQVTQWWGNGLRASDNVLSYLRVGVNGQGVIGAAPHNLYLGTLYDHGLPGLFLLSGVFGSLGCALVRGIRGSRGEQRVLYAAVLAVLATLILQSLFSRDLWIQQIGIPFWLIVALPFAACWRTHKSMLPVPQREAEITRSSALPLCLSIVR